MTVAESLTNLDEAWFTEVLREGGHAEAAVSRAEVEPLEFSGTAGEIARVSLTYDDSGTAGPASVIAKIRGTDEMRAAVDAAMGLYAREAHFYSNHADRVPVSVPRCFHVGDGTETPLLLEDLGGLRGGDGVAGLSVADAEAAFEAIARLHAQYWNEPPADEGFLAQPGDGPYAAMIGQLVASGVGAVRERFSGRVGDGIIEAVAEHAPDWVAVLGRCAEGPQTLVHNDCRLDNLFFRDDGEPVLVDWQIPARTRGTTDPANLIAGSMELEDAAANWQPLLRRYHAGLEDGGVEGYSWEECEQHYRVSVLYGLCPGIAMLGSLSEAGEARGAGDAAALRALKHAEDVDSFGALEAQ